MLFCFVIYNTCTASYLIGIARQYYKRLREIYRKAWWFAMNTIPSSLRAALIPASYPAISPQDIPPTMLHLKPQVVAVGQCCMARHLPFAGFAYVERIQDKRQKVLEQGKGVRTRHDLKVQMRLEG